MIKRRTNRIAVSLALSVAFMAFLVLLGSAGEKPARIIVMLGGTMPEGLIQGATYFLFFWGILEVAVLGSRIRHEEEAFDRHFLVEDKEWVYSADDTYKLKQKLEEKNSQKPYQLLDLAILVCVKYRLSHSSSEALSVLESESANMNAAIESEQSFLRYIAWAIPSVDFIGTVLGIASSLGYANQASTPEGIEHVTSALSVAFDTTLVALFLSVILMLAIHALQKRQDDLYTRLRTYILHNLINRLYH